VRIIKELMEIWPNEVCDITTYYMFFRVDFQLYDQLKKSLYNGMGVLNKSAISMAS